MSNGEGDVNENERISHWILNKLKSYENVILHFQRLLVWEKPLHSSIFMIILHIIFLYVTIRSQHFIGYFSSFMLFLVWIDLWKHKIWPEIRAIPPDSLAEWGELNPMLLSLPEMCDKLAEYYIKTRYQVEHILEIKRLFPGKFCIVFCAACLIIMGIGRKLPGAVLVYVALMSAVLWPLISINNVPRTIYMKLEPFILQFQHTIRQRPNKILEIATKVVVENQRSAPSLNPDEDISEFIPELDDERATILAQATVDSNENSENEGGSKVNSDISGRSTPSFSVQNETYLTALPDKFPNLQEDQEGDDFGIPTYLQSASNQLPVNIQQQVLSTIGQEAMSSALSGAMQNTFSSFMQTVNPNLVTQNSLSSTSSGTPTSDFEILDYESDETTAKKLV